jgi:hypothetical protein
MCWVIAGNDYDITAIPNAGLTVDSYMREKMSQLPERLDHAGSPLFADLAWSIA